MADSSAPLSRRWQCESFWMSVGDKQNQAWCGNRLRYGMHKHASSCENFADYNENRQQHKLALWAIVLGRRRWIYIYVRMVMELKAKNLFTRFKYQDTKAYSTTGSEWMTDWLTGILDLGVFSASNSSKSLFVESGRLTVVWTTLLGSGVSLVGHCHRRRQR